MDLRSSFGTQVVASLNRAKAKLDTIKDWQPCEDAFCEFTDDTHTASFHLPLLRQIELVSNSRFVSELAEVFQKCSFTNRKSFRVVPSFEPDVNYSGAVVRVISLPSLKTLLNRSTLVSSFVSFGEDDPVPSDPSVRDLLSRAVANSTPPYSDQNPWWGVPNEDVPSTADVQWFVNSFGLFHYATSPLPLWLIKYTPSTSSLSKPNVLDARGQKGFWPAKGEWGLTVQVNTFFSGVREALHWHQGPIGSCELEYLSVPEQVPVDWHTFCLSRVKELGC